MANSEVSGHVEAGSSATTIEIKIKTMDSQTYTLQVDKQMPVPALKERVASVTGVVTEHQRLICRGKVLKDDQLLSAYHVEDGHTLHLVVREPTASSSGDLPADPAVDQSSSGNRVHFYQAPGIVVETFSMPGQGDRGLPDVNRIISAVLGSMGIGNPANGNERTGVRDHIGGRPGETPTVHGTLNTSETQPEQSGMRNSNDRSRMNNTFGIPAGFSFGPLQAPVIPDALTTLSQYLSHMRQEFSDSGSSRETEAAAPTPAPGSGDGSSNSAQSDNAQGGLLSPASLAQLLFSSREMLNQQVEECLLQLERQLGNQENMTDPVARAAAQAGALRNGILLQNLGSYFLELGRTITTLRLGRSPSEAVVNAGPAVFISSSGPNPLMVQPLPFQPGASFGTTLAGSMQSSSGLMNGIGSGFVPRRIDIQIRRVGPSTHQTEPAGSGQSAGQGNSTSNVNGEAPVNQSSARTSAAPYFPMPSSLDGSAGRMLPFRSTTMGQDTSSGSLGFLFPSLGSFLSNNSPGIQVPTEHHSGDVQMQSNNSSESAEAPPGNGRPIASHLGERESFSSRTIDINIMSAGGIQNDQSSDGQLPSGVLEFLRDLFPGGEFNVESVGTQGTGMGSVAEQERTGNAGEQEAEPMVTEEGIFLSSLLQQIMPLISENSGGNSSQPEDGSTSTQVENHEVGTSRRADDANAGPNAKRQKRE